MSATILAAGKGWDFVLVGGQVYRVRSGWMPDAQGFPMGGRWECSIAHWTRFRAVYDWVEDVELLAVGTAVLKERAEAMQAGEYRAEDFGE